MRSYQASDDSDGGGESRCLVGCGYGALYTHTTTPLTTNFDRTPASQAPAAAASLKRVRYRFVEVWWDDNALGHIAKENGVDTMYYADRETIRILGIWSQFYVRLRSCCCSRLWPCFSGEERKPSSSSR